LRRTRPNRAASWRMRRYTAAPDWGRREVPKSSGN
jgi:hypothetical protein